jgi:hypothetical protein
LRESVAAILARAVQIEEIVADVAGEHALEQLLASAATCTSICLARLVRILVTRHPRPGELTALVAQIQDPRWRAAADVALSDAADEAIGLFERTATDSAEAAADKAAQLAAMLDAVDVPARHKRVQEARSKIAAACQQRLGAVLRDDVVALLAGSGTGEGVESVERSARNASKLEAASRALDPQSRAQTLLRTAAADVVALRSDGLDDVDRVRLVEILLGPEDAMRIATNLANAGASNAKQQGRSVQW